jgi:hypothetical protein
MNFTLFLALLCLAGWVVFGFVRPIGLGIINLLWAASVVLWIRWWAQKTKLREQSTVNGQR